MAKQLTRRTFLGNAITGGSGLTLLGNSRSIRSYEANDKVNVALVGVGGRGGWFVGIMPKLSNVVAMCDVNDREMDLSFQKIKIPDVKKYHDFRRMLEEMDKQIDAIVVATPDHTHAVISAAAIKMGKHVYCEKPLTHDIHEARALRRLAREHNVATQMGNQGTASRAFRRGVEWIQAGVLGAVREVHAWNTGGGAGERPIPKDVHDVPGFLKWDLWLGPAQYRPYNSRWLNWHMWRDFGTGAIGNWACHTMNIFFKGLKIDSLWSAADVDAKARTIGLDPEPSGVHEATFPRTEILHYAVPARGAMPAVTVHWYNGPGQAPGPREKIEQMLGRKLDWGDAGEKRWQDHAGCLLVGTKGMLHANGHNTVVTLLPRKKFKDFEGPPETLPRSRGHENEWLAACKGGPAAMSNFDYTDPLAEFVLLGNLATRFGRTIEFDPVAMKVVNDAKAHAAIKRDYRKGWSI